MRSARRRWDQMNGEGARRDAPLARDRKEAPPSIIDALGSYEGFKWSQRFTRDRLHELEVFRPSSNARADDELDAAELLLEPTLQGMREVECARAPLGFPAAHLLQANLFA